MPFVLRLPRWSIFLLVVIIYSNVAFILANIHGFKPINYATTALCLGLIPTYRLLYHDNQQGSYKFILAGMIWFAAAFVSLIFSSTTGASPDALLKILPGIILAYCLFFLITDFDRFTIALYGIAVTTVLFACLTVVQTVFGLQGNTLLGFAQGSVEQISSGVDAWRPTGPISDPNFYAQMLLPGLAICMDRALHGTTGRIRAISAVGLSLVFAAILLTASRGGLIAFAVIVLLFIVRERKLLVLLPFIVLTPFVALIVAPSFGERVISAFASVNTLLNGGAGRVDSSVAGRVNEMLAAVLLFIEHPWTGVGYGQFEQHYQAVSARYDLLMRPADRAAHSLYFETAAEQGLVGVAALCAILAMAATSITKAKAAFSAPRQINSRHLIDALGIGMIGFFLASFFLHDAYPRYEWIMLALAFASERTIPQKAPSKRRKPKPSGVPDAIAHS